MRRSLLVSIAVLAILCPAAPAALHAQNKPKAGDSPPKAGKAKLPAGKKVRNFDFTGDDVDGRLVQPEGVQIDVLGYASFASLIRLRKAFVQEMLKETEDI